MRSSLNGKIAVGLPHANAESETQAKASRARAQAALALMMDADVPLPGDDRKHPVSLHRQLTTRYIPNQIPFSSLACSAFITAENIEELAELMQAYSVLGTPERSTMATAPSTLMGTGSAPALRPTSPAAGERYDGVSAMLLGLPARGMGTLQYRIDTPPPLPPQSAPSPSRHSFSTTAGQSLRRSESKEGAVRGSVLSSRAAPATQKQLPPRTQSVSSATPTVKMAPAAAAPSSSPSAPVLATTYYGAGQRYVEYFSHEAGDAALSVEWLVRILLEMIEGNMDLATSASAFDAGGTVLNATVPTLSAMLFEIEKEEGNDLDGDRCRLNNEGGADEDENDGGDEGDKFECTTTLNATSVLNQTAVDFNSRRREARETLLTRYKGELTNWLGLLAQPCREYEHGHVWQLCQAQHRLLGMYNRYCTSGRALTEDGAPGAAGAASGEGVMEGGVLSLLAAQENRRMRRASASTLYLANASGLSRPGDEAEDSRCGSDNAAVVVPRRPSVPFVPSQGALITGPSPLLARQQCTSAAPWKREDEEDHPLARGGGGGLRHSPRRHRASAVWCKVSDLRDPHGVVHGRPESHRSCISLSEGDGVSEVFELLQSSDDEEELGRAEVEGGHGSPSAGGADLTPAQLLRVKSANLPSWRTVLDSPSCLAPHVAVMHAVQAEAAAALQEPLLGDKRSSSARWTGKQSRRSTNMDGAGSQVISSSAPSRATGSPATTKSAVSGNPWLAAAEASLRGANASMAASSVTAAALLNAQKRKGVAVAAAPVAPKRATELSLVCWSDITQNLMLGLEQTWSTRGQRPTYTRVPTVALEDVEGAGEEVEGARLPQGARAMEGPRGAPAHRRNTEDGAADGEDEDAEEEEDVGPLQHHTSGVRRRLPVTKQGGDPRQEQALLADMETFASALRCLHAKSADCVLTSPSQQYVVTSSKDGLVKVWDTRIGQFITTILNLGSAWVLSMNFLHKESYLMVITTAAEITVVRFPAGGVVTKMRGCTSPLTAIPTVTQLPSTHTQRYGLKPGECGPHRPVLSENCNADTFRALRSIAQANTAEETIPVRALIGYVAPSAVHFDAGSGVLFFGTASGVIGSVDLADALQATALLNAASGARSALTTLYARNVVAAHVFDAAAVATSSHLPSSPYSRVVGIYYFPVLHCIISCGQDGHVVRTPYVREVLGSGGANSSDDEEHGGEETGRGAVGGATATPTATAPSVRYVAGEPLVVAHLPKAIRFLRGCVSARLFLTVQSDRRALLWSVSRTGTDLVHQYPQDAYDIIDCCFIAPKQQMVILTEDRSIRLYDYYGARPLTLISAPKAPSSRVEDVAAVTIRSSLHDGEGCLSYLPSTQRIVCALRGPVMYAPSVLEEVTLPSSSSPRFDRKDADREERKESREDEEREEEVEKSAKDCPRDPLLLSTFQQERERRAQAIALLRRAQRHVRRYQTHQGTVVATVLEQQPSSSGANGNNTNSEWGSGSRLHSLSHSTWRVFAVETGKPIRSTCNIAAVARREMPRLAKKAHVLCCSWSTTHSTRLLAGARDGAVVTLDPATGTVVNIDELFTGGREGPNGGIQDKRTQEKGDATVLNYNSNRAFLCAGRTCVVRRYAAGTVDAVGAEQAISMRVHLPEEAVGATITACCAVRDTHVCVGGSDTTLYFYRFIDGSAPTHEVELRNPNGDQQLEVGSVMGLYFLNEHNENILVVVLDTGVVLLLSCLTYTVVARLRLPVQGAENLTQTAWIGRRQLLVCGDSVGVAHFVDVRSHGGANTPRGGSTAEGGVSVPFLNSMAAAGGSMTSPPPLHRDGGTSSVSSAAPPPAPYGLRYRCSYRVALDAISALTSHTAAPSLLPRHLEGEEGHAAPLLQSAALTPLHLIVGSSDGNVRLYAVTETMPMDSLTPPLRSSLERDGTSPTRVRASPTQSAGELYPGPRFSCASLQRGVSLVSGLPGYEVTLVGLFGVDEWNLSDPETFTGEVRKVSIDKPAGEDGTEEETTVETVLLPVFLPASELRAARGTGGADLVAEVLRGSKRVVRAPVGLGGMEDTAAGATTMTTATDPFASSPKDRRVGEGTLRSTTTPTRAAAGAPTSAPTSPSPLPPQAGEGVAAPLSSWDAVPYTIQSMFPTGERLTSPWSVQEVDETATPLPMSTLVQHSATTPAKERRLRRLLRSYPVSLLRQVGLLHPLDTRPDVDPITGATITVDAAEVAALRRAMTQALQSAETGVAPEEEEEVTSPLGPSWKEERPVFLTEGGDGMEDEGEEGEGGPHPASRRRRQLLTDAQMGVVSFPCSASGDPGTLPPTASAKTRLQRKKSRTMCGIGSLNSPVGGQSLISDSGTSSIGRPGSGSLRLAGSVLLPRGSLGSDTASKSHTTLLTPMELEDGLPSLHSRKDTMNGRPPRSQLSLTVPMNLLLSDSDEDEDESVGRHNKTRSVRKGSREEELVGTGTQGRLPRQRSWITAPVKTGAFASVTGPMERRGSTTSSGKTPTDSSARASGPFASVRQLEAALAGVDSAVLEQRRDQVMLAHLAGRLDRLGGTPVSAAAGKGEEQAAPPSFTAALEASWRRRAGEAATHTAMVEAAATGNYQKGCLLATKQSSRGVQKEVREMFKAAMQPPKGAPATASLFGLNMQLLALPTEAPPRDVDEESGRSPREEKEVRGTPQERLDAALRRSRRRRERGTTSSIVEGIPGGGGAASPSAASVAGRQALQPVHVSLPSFMQRNESEKIMLRQFQNVFGGEKDGARRPPSRDGAASTHTTSSSSDARRAKGIPGPLYKTMNHTV